MGLTRRLLALALALGVGGTSVPARSVAAASPVRPLAGVRTWVVYYGAAPEAARDLARFDVVVLDPHGHPPLSLVKLHGWAFDIASTPGCGTTVTIAMRGAMLPAEASPAAYAKVG